MRNWLFSKNNVNSSFIKARTNNVMNNNAASRNAATKLRLALPSRIFNQNSVFARSNGLF